MQTLHISVEQIFPISNFPQLGPRGGGVIKFQIFPKFKKALSVGREGDSQLSPFSFLILLKLGIRKRPYFCMFLLIFRDMVILWILPYSELHRIVNLTEYQMYSFLKNFQIPNSIRSWKFFEYRIPNIFVHEEFPNTEYRIVFVHENFSNTKYRIVLVHEILRIPNSICSWKCMNTD